MNRTIQTKDIMASLPLVASILGDRYGVTVHIGGKEAYTNGKSIHLPTLPLDCDAELLALARSFVDHESAHIRHTDFVALRAARLTPMQKHLWNSLEDFMVEQKLAALFPGCRQHFRWLIRHFFGKNDTNEAGNTPTRGALPALSVLNWVLLTVRAWEVPEIAPQRDKEAKAVDAAYPGLRTQLEAVLSRVQQDCQSTQDAIRYAVELSAIIEKFANNSNKQKERTPPKTTQGNTPSNDCSCQSEETVPTDSEEQTVQPADRQSLQALMRASAQDLPLSLGEQLAETLSAQHAHDSHQGVRVAQVGHKYTTALPTDIRAATLASTVALRARLHGLLQATTQQPCAIGRRGKLHAQKLHAVAVNNPRVFLKRGEKRQVATAVHVLVDCSGSMQGASMELASRACYAVAVALERCNGVSVGVTAFPAMVETDPNAIAVAPLVRHGERVYGNFSLHAHGYTPLAESLWWVMQQMYPLKEERKIILILSDGMPNSAPAAQHALKQAATLGFEVMGLGIQDNSMNQLLPAASRTINELSELAPAMFAMLQKALLGSGGRS